MTNHIINQTQTQNFKSYKSIGLLLIIGAIGVLIPYTILTITFEYPDILRQDVATILSKFRAAGAPLIFTWLAFALLGMPLMLAYIKIGQIFEKQYSNIKWITTIGVVSGIVQIIALLRWVFVVPVIASTYANASDLASQEAAKMAFVLIHQFAGVLLGEHIGQLFTIIWTIMISITFLKSSFFPKYLAYLGIFSSIIYFMAQAELLATVINYFPVWNLAGFIGSTMWLIWLILIGVYFLRKQE